MNMIWQEEVTITVVIPEEVRLRLFEMILEQGENFNERNMVGLIKFVMTEVRQNEETPLSLRAAKNIVDEVRRRLSNWCGVSSQF